MLEALHTLVPFVNSREKTLHARKDDALFSKGRWGLRYDPKQRDIWRRAGEEHRRMIERDPENFWRYLQSQSPAEQYAVLELISQAAFGSGNNGEVKPNVEPKQVGELFADLIRSHFRVPTGSEEFIQSAEKRRKEFTEQAWRLTIPQTSLMFTILKVTPDLSSPSFSEEVIPYVDGIVHHMGEQAKRNLGDQIISQLESLGIYVDLAE